MYVYMGKYVKMKKKKKKMIYQKNCKDNLRTLFVEILVLLYKGQQTGFAFRFCPAKNRTQSQPTKTILVYSRNPLLFCEDFSTS